MGDTIPPAAQTHNAWARADVPEGSRQPGLQYANLFGHGASQACFTRPIKQAGWGAPDFHAGDDGRRQDDANR